MIPVFPHFKPLTIEDQEEVETILRRFPPYSDFNFANLFCYNTHGDILLSMIYGNLIVRMHDYLNQVPFFTFIGQQRVLSTVERLLLRSTEEGLRPQLRLIPGLQIEASYRDLCNRFEIQEDPDGFDYIHAVDHLTELDAPQLRSKRRCISRLRKRFPHITVREVDLSDPKESRSIRALYDLWQDKKSRSGSMFQAEEVALGRCLHYAHCFNFVAVGAFLGDILAGFTINEPVHDNFYMGHFGKSDPDITGCGDLLEFETAKVMRQRGCVRMNNQQDLGLVGLRRYKQSWRPNRFLKKYTLSGWYDYY
jgi:hypothetical protein